MLARRLIVPARLSELFVAIEPELLRYPAVDPLILRSAVQALVGSTGHH
jgi:hypothetical protein